MLKHACVLPATHKSPTGATAIFMLKISCMYSLLSTLPPVHILSFINLARIVFELSHNSTFSGQMDGSRDTQTDRWRVNLQPPLWSKGWDDISIHPYISIWTWQIPYRHTWVPYCHTFRNFTSNKFGNF